jgi:hypothetical protein
MPEGVAWRGCNPLYFQGFIGLTAPEPAKPLFCEDKPLKYNRKLNLSGPAVHCF